ncbi:putative Phosphate transporter pho1-like 10 [Cocos nucifera]|nr:putative Phosphate transporter pho1-like 10 [Cocos nucifera]
MQARTNMKLTPKYYEPFPLIQRISLVAFELQLPPNNSIHPVFHVSLLKKKVGNNTKASTTLPSANIEGISRVEPQGMLN